MFLPPVAVCFLLFTEFEPPISEELIPSTGEHSDHFDYGERNIFVYVTGLFS